MAKGFQCVFCGHAKDVGPLREVERGKWHTIGYCPRCGESTHSEHKSTDELLEMGIELPQFDRTHNTN